MPPGGNAASVHPREGSSRPGILRELLSELLKGGYIGDYIREYYTGH